jgi:hypothetical protein
MNQGPHLRALESPPKHDLNKEMDYFYYVVDTIYFEADCVCDI